MRRNDINKATHAKLCKLFAFLVAEFGARPSHIQGWYDVEIDTPLGLLFLSRPDKDFGTMFGRFDDVERAKQSADCNPYTGKWNHHPSKGTAPEMIQCFEHDLRKLMTKGS